MAKSVIANCSQLFQIRTNFHHTSKKKVELRIHQSINHLVLRIYFHSSEDNINVHIRLEKHCKIIIIILDDFILIFSIYKAKFLTKYKTP